MKEKITLKHVPLLSWDLSNPLSALKNNRAIELAQLTQLAGKNGWQVDIKSELEVYYHAIVVTDIQQNIHWVSQGFQSMTGYQPEFAIGKTPSFLQGENTSTEVKQRIRENLGSGRRFTETLINYRQNREEYRCQITVVPLSNWVNEITHFMALEREI
ncbi:PAS domain-containing protein [Algoriphagus sp. AGSA1]|uniref:PAS domain-containing protein n=1 Tax=Algoriphagus sp. AGSA1 TaxID=2907213 RepID=UPI001F34DEE2|nr:PAS domain-containing protein [Algoriphagus sp. AGSA1]MCE7057429.1 PAS domain-containing protein [Algoriphagus sp. AGSA1]